MIKRIESVQLLLRNYLTYKKRLLLEVIVRNCIIRIPELLLVDIFSLFVLSNYGINYWKRWFQPAVLVLLYRV